MSSGVRVNREARARAVTIANLVWCIHSRPGAEGTLPLLGLPLEVWTEREG